MVARSTWSCSRTKEAESGRSFSLCLPESAPDHVDRVTVLPSPPPEWSFPSLGTSEASVLSKSNSSSGSKTTWSHGRHGPVALGRKNSAAFLLSCFPQWEQNNHADRATVSPPGLFSRASCQNPCPSGVKEGIHALHAEGKPFLSPQWLSDHVDHAFSFLLAPRLSLGDGSGLDLAHPE